MARFRRGQPPPIGVSMTRGPSSNRPDPVTVILVSPLPPPQGGIAAWTETVLRRGLPHPWTVRVVDTRLRGRTVADERPSLPVEIPRTAAILLQLIRSLLKGPRDIVHVNCSLSYSGVFRDWACVMIARLFRTPVVVNLHGTLAGRFGTGIAGRFRRAAYRSMFRSAGAIVVLNRPSRETVLSVGDFGGKTEVMPNLLDCTTMPDRDMSASAESPFTAVYVGALRETKGIATIVEAARECSGVRFVLVGDIPEGRAADIRRRIASAGVEDRLTLTGPLSHEEALGAMASGDVYIFPSHHEGFPVSVAEAMAIGLPVVASPVGAIPEMIDERRGGFLIPHDEPARYAEALATLRDDPELARRMGRYNWEKARAQYDYEVVIPRWCDLYDRISRGPAASGS